MAGLAFLWNPATSSRRLGLGRVAHAPVALGFSLAHEVTDEMLVEVLDVQDPRTVITTLPNSFERRFQDVPSGVGAGSLEIVVDDAAVGDIDTEKMLRWRLRGRPAMQSLVEMIVKVAVTQTEEAGEVLRVSGRSLIALLEEAVVFPSRGPATLPIEDSRVFNFASDDYDDTGWPAAAVMAYQAFSPEWWSGQPARWPAADAAWIWGPQGTSLIAPVGACWFRKRFTVPDGVTSIDLFLACDNEAELWFDGQRVAQTDDWHESRRVQIPVTPGTHLLAVKARNNQGGGPLYATVPTAPADRTYTVVTRDTLWDIAGKTEHYADPTKWPIIYNANKALIDTTAASAGLPYTGRWAGHWIFPGQVLTIPGVPSTATVQQVVGWVNPGGLLVAVYASTGDGLGQQLSVSNASWKCLAYPANEPGMTPGEVLGILLVEAQNRGALEGLVWTFHPTTDSAGRPWRRVGDISTRVGDDLLTVIRQLGQTYVEFAMRPAGLVLDVYDIDTPVAAPIATFTIPSDPDDPTSGNLTGLTIERRA